MPYLQLLYKGFPPLITNLLSSYTRLFSAFQILPMLHHNQAHSVYTEKNGSYSLRTPKQRLSPRRGHIKKKIFSKLIKNVVSLMAGIRRSGGNGGGCLKYSTSKTSPQDV